MMPDFSIYNDYVKLPLSEFDNLDDKFVPPEVCHYTNLQTALEKIIPTKRLLLGKITSTNDPLESGEIGKRHFHALTGDHFSGQMNGTYETDLQPTGPLTKVREQWRVLCTCCHHNPAIHFMDESNIRLSDHHKFGISYSRMWAQYAGKHSGICLLFDGKKLDENIRETLKPQEYKVHTGFVRYNYEKSVEDKQMDPEYDFLNYNTNTREESIRDNLDKNYRKYFLYKSEEWMSEREFRWLVNNPNLCEEVYVPIDTTLKAVIVGAKAGVYIPSVSELCKPLGIRVFKMKWFDGKPRAESVPVN